MRHKFLEQVCAFLLKKGVMPGIAALTPAWTAGVECCLSDGSPPDFLLLLCEEDCSDLAHWWAPHLAFGEAVAGRLPAGVEAATFTCFWRGESEATPAQTSCEAGFSVCVRLHP